MTLTIDLTGDEVEGLAQQARRSGMDVSSYIRRLLRLGLTDGDAQPLSPMDMRGTTREERQRILEAVPESLAHLNLPVLSDEQTRRESIYDDQGLA